MLKPRSLSKQPLDNKALTQTGKPNSKSQKQNLALSLFLESELDADLKLIIERWAKLSVDIKRAIVTIVETS